jgi:ketosteroid isomerase-like protein
MSQENVETVRRFLELVNDDRVDLALSLVDPAAQLDWSDSQAPDSGVYEGPDQWGGWIAGRSEEMAETRFEIAELTDVPPDRVLLVAAMHGRGRASGVEISGLGAAVCTVRDGRLTKLTLYQSREEALAALGPDAPSG